MNELLHRFGYSCVHFFSNLKLFGISAWVNMCHLGYYSRLRAISGPFDAVAPVITILTIFKLVRAVANGHFKAVEYKNNFLAYAFTGNANCKLNRGK